MSKMVKAASRVAAEKRGRRAEDIAALVLRLKGFKILERRYKTKLGEIDIIARRKNILAIIEVKQRRTVESGHESLHPMTLRRIEEAADLYQTRNSHVRDLEMRFDVIFVLPGWRIKHLADAWRRY